MVLLQKSFLKNVQDVKKGYLHCFQNQSRSLFFKKIAIYLKYILGIEKARRAREGGNPFIPFKIGSIILIKPNGAEKYGEEGGGGGYFLCVKCFSSGDSFSSFIMMIMPSFILSLN